jgi:hypothetical protein
MAHAPFTKEGDCRVARKRLGSGGRARQAPSFARFRRGAYDADCAEGFCAWDVPVFLCFLEGA